MTKGEKIWSEFADELISSIRQALDTGAPARLCLGGKFDITIDIYQTTGDMKKITDSLTKAALEKFEAIQIDDDPSEVH